MADRYPAQTVAMNWSESKWSAADDDAQDQPKPTTGDHVIFTANSNTVTMDEASAVVGNFTLGGGTIVGTGQQLNMSGDLTFTAGTATNLSVVHSGTANVTWSGPGQALAELTVDTGATVTLTGSLYTKKATITGDIAGAAQFLFIYNTAAAWWGPQTGSVTCKLACLEVTGAPGNNVTTTNTDFYVYTANTISLTMDADIDIGTGDLYIYANAAGEVMTLDLAGNNLTCEHIRVGPTAATAAGGILYCGEGTISCTSLAEGHADNAGHEVHFETSTFTASGNMTLDGITCTTGAATITATNLYIGTDGTLTLTDDLTLNTTLEPDGGTLDCGSNDIANDGSFNYVSGTLSNSGKFTLTGSDAHNVAWNSSGNKIAEFAVDTNATATLTGNTYCRKVSGGGTITGASTLRLDLVVDNFWAFTGTMSASVVVYNTGNVSTGGAINIGNGQNLSITLPDTIITADASITVAGVLTLYGSGAGNATTLAMGSNSLVVVGNTVLGGGAVDLSGILDLGTGTHSIASLVDGNAANLNNAIDFASSNTSISGTLDGDNIACSNTAGLTVGGTVDNVDLSGEGEMFHLYPAAAGSGNTNVTEISPATGSPEHKGNAYVYVA